MSTGGPEEDEGTGRVEAESTVNESFGTTIPVEVRRALREGVKPGDRVRWVVADGEVSIEIVHERFGAFDDLDALDGPEWNSEAVAEESWEE